MSVVTFIDLCERLAVAFLQCGALCPFSHYFKVFYLHILYLLGLWGTSETRIVSHMEYTFPNLLGIQELAAPIQTL